MLCPDVDSPVQETWTHGRESSKVPQKTANGLKNMKRLRELGLFSLQKRKFKGMPYQCVKTPDRRCKEVKGTLLGAAQ